MVEYGLIFRLLLPFFLFHFFLEGKFASKETQERVSPYLMSDDHPIKSSLDALFSSSRVILNLDTLEKGGFKKAKPRKFTKLIVTTHPKFPGYLFKLYLDAQRYHKDWLEHEFWILRVQGAKNVHDTIENLGLSSTFKVPQKWIYPLPKQPLPSLGYLTKYYILVEEDMDILPSDENQSLWASDNYITPSLLENLYQILKVVGLRDGAKPDNIPFSRDGRIAFIDTQTFDSEVDYKKLIPYLSKSNQVYWKYLIKE